VAEAMSVCLAGDSLAAARNFPFTFSVALCGGRSINQIVWLLVRSKSTWRLVWSHEVLAAAHRRFSKVWREKRTADMMIFFFLCFHPFLLPLHRSLSPSPLEILFFSLLSGQTVNGSSMH
jgi:hypothetical protein